MNSPPSLMVKQLSGLLSTARLDSTSILRQVRNIKNSFSSTGFMYPLTSMVTTAIIMRQNSRELYTVIHPTCTGKLFMKIFSLTTYTQLDYMPKYRIFSKLFSKDMNKPMNTYHPRLCWPHMQMTAHPAKILPQVNYLHKHFRINLHTKTTAHAIIKSPAKLPSYTSSILRLRSIMRTTLIFSWQKLSFHSLQTKHKIIVTYVIMSKNIDICQGGWQSPDSVLEYSRRNPENWDFWTRTIRPKAPGLCLKLQKRSKYILVDNHLTKRVKIEKGVLFDLLTVAILSIIDDCSIRF